MSEKSVRIPIVRADISSDYSFKSVCTLILIYNLKHKDKPKDLLTAEEVELLTVPSDLAEYKTAITEALYKGTNEILK